MSLAQLLHEKLQRESLDARIRGAIKNRFEIIPHRRWESSATAERVRRIEVYAACGEALEVYAVSNTFLRRVRAAAVALGAAAVLQHGGGHVFAWMRPRIAAGDRKALEAATKAWRAKCEASGDFADIERPDGQLKRLPKALERAEKRPDEDEDEATYDATKDHGRALRFAQQAGHFDMARDLYWKLERDLRVWELYAMEGRTVREIAAALDLGRDVVHRALTRVRTQLPGQPAYVEDSDDGEEDS